jgi:hypothetical protein
MSQITTIIELRDSCEGIEITAIQTAGIRVPLDVPQRVRASELARFASTEGVRLIVREDT